MRRRLSLRAPSETHRGIAAIAFMSLCVLAVAAGLGGGARAEDPYPSKPVRLVLPQPAGGAVDLTRARSATA
jgi:tripartite-type tricarboxylate transporter receptor subunit TctC